MLFTLACQILGKLIVSKVGSDKDFIMIIEIYFDSQPNCMMRMYKEQLFFMAKDENDNLSFFTVKN